MVYKFVIDKERALGFAGKCVDPIPVARWDYAADRPIGGEN